MSKLSPQSGSFTEAIFQHYFPKPLYKTIASKRLCFKAIFQGDSPKLFSKAAPKSSPKVVVESCSSKLRSTKAASES
jgi:hypothetical protein